MTTDKRPARWRDFAHTASVRLAGAIAAHEAAQRVAVKSVPRHVRQTFTFALMAASTGDEPALPSGGYEATEGGLAISATPGAGQVVVALRLQGVDALEMGAGQEARLSSDDGLISRTVRFDDDGLATVRLDDGEAVRSALTRLRVDVLAEPEG